MESRWDIAAVVVAIAAIPLAMSPMAMHIVVVISTLMLRRIYSTAARRARLAWTDVPSGTLHECTIPIDSCMESTNDTRHSWNVVITRLFVHIRHVQYCTVVQKPKEFSLGTNYVQTDTQNLKASFLFLRPLEASGP